MEKIEKLTVSIRRYPSNNWTDQNGLAAESCADHRDDSGQNGDGVYDELEFRDIWAELDDVLGLQPPCPPTNGEHSPVGTPRVDEATGSLPRRNSRRPGKVFHPYLNGEQFGIVS